jgi:hypothetical protein
MLHGACLVESLSWAEAGPSKWTRFARRCLLVVRLKLESHDNSSSRIYEGGGGIPPFVWRRGGLNMALTMDNKKFKFVPEPMSRSQAGNFD